MRRFWRWAWDRLDYGRARGLVRTLGHDGYLVSLRPVRGGWRAVVSLVEDDGERFAHRGETRCDAIWDALFLAQLRSAAIELEDGEDESDAWAFA